MKKARIILLIGLLITTMVLLGYVFYVPYYVDESGLYITLYEADISLAARVFIIIILSWTVIGVSFVITIVKPSLLYNEYIHYFLKITPIFTIIPFITWFILDLFMQTSDYSIMQLGYDFVNANIAHYPETITHEEIVSIGQSLNNGIGKYLLWILSVLLIGEYVWYYKNFNKIFNIEDKI